MANKKSGKKSQAQIKREITIKRKEAQSFTLRMAGASFQQIADTVGYKDPSGAFRAFNRALKRLIIEEPDEMRLLELSRLDAIQMEIYRRAQQGELGAIDRYLKIAERRAKLMGIDAPTKLEHDWRRELEEAGIDNASEIFEDMVQYYSELLNDS